MKCWILFFIEIFLSNFLYSQVPNLSGNWEGTINLNQAKTFKLSIVLTDPCALTYRVSQVEDSGKTVFQYNMIQSQNVLVRDAISLWKSSINTGAAHLRLEYNGKELLGIRNELEEPNSVGEIIKLTRQGKNSVIAPCNPPKPIYIKEPKNLICSDAKRVIVPDDVFPVKDSSIVMVYVKDNAGNDSDRVTLFFGKEKMLSNTLLYSDVSYILPYKILGNSTITWCACNQGFSGLNTGVLYLQEYCNTELIKSKSIPINLKKNEQTNILIYIEK